MIEKLVHLTPPSCWDDGSCDSPIRCYLDGCKRTGYVSPYSTKQQRQHTVDRKLAPKIEDI
jgi:hypothetical protein